ncbi:hypothetical protein Ddc_10581 [Ditylenchus destructor]|nr:hypothetical protein Ddc_10581 [Ditylenchus destructor]
MTDVAYGYMPFQYWDRLNESANTALIASEKAAAIRFSEVIATFIKSGHPKGAILFKRNINMARYLAIVEDSTIIKTVSPAFYSQLKLDAWSKFIKIRKMQLKMK